MPKEATQIDWGFIIGWAGAIITLLVAVVGYLLRQRDVRQDKRDDETDKRFDKIGDTFDRIGETLADMKTMLALHDKDIKQLNERIGKATRR